MKKNIAIAIFAAALIVALAAAAGPSEETGGQVQPMDPYGLQTTCIGPDGGTYSCRVPVPAAGVFVNGGWVQQTTCTTTPATGSPGSSTTYPMPVYTPATTASNGNQALAAGLIALGDAGYNAATQVPIPDAGLNGYQTITVQNMGTSAVWCGPASTVNSVSGQQLDPSPDGVHAGGLYSSPLPTYCWSAAAMTSPNDLRWSEVK